MMQSENHIVGPSFGVGRVDCIKDLYQQNESVLLSICVPLFGE
jgi:hypothetical protein